MDVLLFLFMVLAQGRIIGKIMPNRLVLVWLVIWEETGLQIEPLVEQLVHSFETPLVQQAVKQQNMLLTELKISIIITINNN